MAEGRTNVGIADLLGRKKRARRARFDQPAHLIAGQRQHPIQDHQIERMLVDQIECFSRATGDQCLVAAFLEQHCDQFRNVGIILDHQDDRGICHMLLTTLALTPASLT